jgi:hypothetical protein
MGHARFSVRKIKSNQIFSKSTLVLLSAAISLRYPGPLHNTGV